MAKLRLQAVRNCCRVPAFPRMSSLRSKNDHPRPPKPRAEAISNEVLRSTIVEGGKPRTAGPETGSPEESLPRARGELRGRADGLCGRLHPNTGRGRSPGVANRQAPRNGLHTPAGPSFYPGFSGIRAFET